MDKTAAFCVPNVAPLVGLMRVRLMVSVFSTKVSLAIGMVTNFSVSPLAKVTGIEAIS